MTMTQQDSIATGWSLVWQSWLANLWRVLKNWMREPSSLAMVIVAPLIYLFIMFRLFGALSESFTGHWDRNAGVILVVFSWAFILVITGTGQVFAERTHGFHDRLATMPASYAVVLAARAVAEFLRVFVMAVIVTVVSDLCSSSDVLTSAPWRALLVIVLISLAAGAFGTYVGFSITSAQGSVIFMPLIMVAMFINTALLPASFYRPWLAGIARNAPVSAAEQALSGGSVLPILLWCGGIFLLSVAGLAHLSRSRSRGETH